jgi:hypothetical protein
MRATLEEDPCEETQAQLRLAIELVVRTTSEAQAVDLE